MARVFMVGHRFVADGLSEARPAGSAVIFRLALEQLQTATSANIVAGLMVVIQTSGERGLCAAFAQHMIAFGRKALAPFGLGEFEFFHEMNMDRQRHVIKRGSVSLRPTI